VVYGLEHRINPGSKAEASYSFETPGIHIRGYTVSQPRKTSYELQTVYKITKEREHKELNWPDLFVNIARRPDVLQLVVTNLFGVAGALLGNKA